MSHHYKGSYVRLATVLSLGNLISHASPQQGPLQWNGAAQAFAGPDQPSRARQYPLLAPRAEQQDAPAGRQQMSKSEEHAGVGNELLQRASAILNANAELLRQNDENETMRRLNGWYNIYLDQQRREIDAQQRTIICKSIVSALGVGGAFHVLGHFGSYVATLLQSEGKCNYGRLPAQHLSCNDKVAAVEVMIIPCFIAGVGLNMLHNYWQRYKALEQCKNDEQALLPTPLLSEQLARAQVQNATLQAFITDAVRITDIASLRQALERAGQERGSFWAREITDVNYELLLGSECAALAREIMQQSQRAQIPPAAPLVDRAS